MLGIVLLIAMWTVIHPWPTPDRSYTVAEVVAGLAQQPRLWEGRTVWVRATVIDLRQQFPSAPTTWVILTPPLPSLSPSMTLAERFIEADSTRPGAMLVLQTRAPDTALSLLRQVPILGRLVPPPQRGSTFSSGVYQVHLAQHLCPRHRPHPQRRAGPALPGQGQGPNVCYDMAR
jgi:hypothetical protein